MKSRITPSCYGLCAIVAVNDGPSIIDNDVNALEGLMMLSSKINKNSALCSFHTKVN